MEQIIRCVKKPIKPTDYAGELDDNNCVKVLEKNGKTVREAEGLASWYSVEDSGRQTATGIELENEKDYVAVNERLGYELPCIVKITNLKNGKSKEAIAVDHGPYKFNRYGNAIKNRFGKYIPHQSRIIDTTKRVARELDFYKNGLTKIKVEYLRPVRNN